MSDQELTSTLPVSSHPETQPSLKASKALPAVSLAEFWTAFRLSPNRTEHRILTSSVWLGLSAAGPIFLSILIALWSVLVNSRGKPGLSAVDIFTDLSDPIFAFLSLALFLGAMIYRFRWYPSLQPAFQSMIDNHVLRTGLGEEVDEASYLQFLEKFRERLHSRMRYLFPAVLESLFLITSLILTNLNSFWTAPASMTGVSRVIYYLDILPGWFIGPLLWAFLGGQMFWTIYVTTATVRSLTTRYQVIVQPLHSDRAGGLTKLGDLCSNVGLIILVVTIPAIFLAIQGLIAGSIRTACAPDFAPVAAGLTGNLTRERLGECAYYALGGFNSSTSREVIAAWLASDQQYGFTIDQSARRFLDANPGIFDLTNTLARQSLFYAMLGASLAMIIFAFVIVVRPLWEVHLEMENFRIRREWEVNERVSSLYNECSDFIRQNRLEEAEKIQAKIKFLGEELNQIEKYPRWPIHSRVVLRSYLSSGVLSALITYIVSLFKFSVSPAFLDILVQALKTMVGGG